MKVSELAKELNTTSKDILTTLKALKLKSIDSKQELNAVVISVLRSEYKKGKDSTTKKEASTVTTKKKAVKKETLVDKKEKAKEPVKKATTKKKAAKATDTKEKTVVEAKATTKKTATPKDKEEKPKEPIRKKKKISNEPVITLKPLARKRRKSTPNRTHATPGASDESSATAAQQVPQSGGITSDDTAGSSDQESSVPRDESLPDIEIKVPITVKDFSLKIGQRSSAVLKFLMKMGVFAHINQALDRDVVEKLTPEFGFNLAKIKTQEEQIIEGHKQEEEDESLLTSRAPVVTFMGHVDHGKTSLLDKIRKSKVTDKEHGGITQHMGAYSVNIERGRITFLDTPGHEAFTAMRRRGAHITDLVVLVVAADEGIMPQTKEAIDHALAADVPIIVALNKIDRPNADLDKVKKQLSELNLASEDWGGNTVCVGVSAMTGEGVDKLLEMILLESEMLELKANADKKSLGLVVEAHLSQGKGVVATFIVQSGTLKESDMVVVGPHYGKIKAMFDDHKRLVKEAGPSMPVEVLGLPGVPEAGEMYYVVDDEKQAREITVRRTQEIKDKRLYATQKLTLEDLYSQIQEGSIKELNVIVKADVQGSLEALKDSLEKIPSDRVKVRFIHVGVGDVNASDVLLAVASNAIIIAFHVGIGPRAKEELEKDPVDIREYRIIYDAVNDMRNALEGLLDAKVNKKFISRIEIREVFKLSRSGFVAGCYVTKGKVHRKASVDIMREDEVVHTGKISSLKRFKEDVKDVNEGMECGITLEGFDKYKVGDIIEAYEIESIAQKL